MSFKSYSGKLLSFKLRLREVKDGNPAQNVFVLIQ